MSTETPPSPCVRVCTLDPSQRFCVGCWRSTEEIAAWATMNHSQKRTTLERTEARKAVRREEMRELRRRRRGERDRTR